VNDRTAQPAARRLLRLAARDLVLHVNVLFDRPLDPVPHPRTLDHRPLLGAKVPAPHL
jgi:hypothetical protein